MFKAEPHALAPVAEADADAIELSKLCEHFRVTDGGSYELAQQALLDLGPRIKHVTELQKRAKEAVKILLAPYERPLKTYQRLKDYLKQEILGYERAERTKADALELEAAKLLQAARESGEADVAQRAQEQAHALVVASALQPERAKGISRTYTYRAEITDPSKVPDDFWVIDLAALNALARSSKGSAEVPGVRFEVIEGVRA